MVSIPSGYIAAGHTVAMIKISSACIDHPQKLHNFFPRLKPPAEGVLLSVLPELFFHSFVLSLLPEASPNLSHA